MIHIEDEIFLKKKFDFDKLKSFDFSIVDNKYIYTEDFMDSNFKAIIDGFMISDNIENIYVETTDTKTIRNELFDINLESKNEYITARINHRTEHGYNYCREEFTIVLQLLKNHSF